MKSTSSWMLRAIAGMASLLLASCGGGGGGPRQLIAISVQPASGQAIAPDGTVPFSATGTFDQAPTTQANLPVQWASSDSTIATIDANTGIATCLVVGGPVIVTASAAGRGGTVHSSSTLACQLSPNPVVKLDPPGIGAVCFQGFDGGCACTYTPGRKATVTNVGGAPLVISSVALFHGTNFFSQTNSCSAALETGQSCEIDVDFRPTQIGNFKDEVLISDDAADSPQVLGLSGVSNCSAPIP